MPFQRPTLPELIDRVQQDLQTRLTLSGPVLRRSVVYVVARVLAAAVHGLYGFLSFLGTQLFPDTSTTTYLERQANVFSITRVAATYATGTATATGSNGTQIPAATLLTRADGTVYSTNDLQTISGGVATLNLTAVAAGEDGNVDTGTLLTLQQPIAGVATVITVASPGLSGGADAETDDALRARFLTRLQAPPQGGSSDDYVTWALSVGGVTRAWVYPQELGAGAVTVRFVRDNDGTGSAIVPDSGEVAAVQAVIDGVRPVTATVTVVAPIADALNFTMHIVPDVPEARAAIIAELTDLLARAGKPGGTILLSSIRTAIGVADDITDFSLASPNADVTYATGHLPVMGTVTWT
jgi:uncharacterized phage protein gp47/JayE